MADDVDITTDRFEVELANKIAIIASKKREIEAIGECHFCGVDLSPPRRWCDAYCRDSWEKLERKREAEGGWTDDGESTVH